MFNQAWLHQSVHMQLAALQAVGIAVGGIHAWLYLRGRTPGLNNPSFLPLSEPHFSPSCAPTPKKQFPWQSS